MARIRWRHQRFDGKNQCVQTNHNLAFSGHCCAHTLTWTAMEKCQSNDNFTHTNISTQIMSSQTLWYRCNKTAGKKGNHHYRREFFEFGVSYCFHCRVFWNGLVQRCIVVCSRNGKNSIHSIMQRRPISLCW